MDAFTRRAILRLFTSLSATLLPALGRAAPEPAIRDQGIGGTGARPDSEKDDAPLGGGDRGIGGTGVIGTIRRFGSIVVNDLRIAYPADVGVHIDGAPAKASDLKIGQVVRVVAQAAGGGLTTRRIDVTSEVVGPVEAAGKDRLTVLGQRVSTSGLGGSWPVGARVAVSGLRRPDGVVVASLIESRPSGPDRIAGPVRRGADGAMLIGGLRIEGASLAFVGQRAVFTGVLTDGALRVTSASQAGASFAQGLKQVSIEAYIGRKGARLALGSGIGVAGRASAAVPSRGSVRAILTADVAHDGQLSLERLHIDQRTAPGLPERAPGALDGRDGPVGPGRNEHMPDRFGPRDGLPGVGPDRQGGSLSPRGLDLDTRGMPGERPGGFGGGPAPGGFGGGPGGGFGGPGGGGPGPGPGPGGGPGGFGGGRR